MKVKLLDGSTAEIQLRNYVYNPKVETRSKFQTKVGRQLSEQFPHDIIFGEVRIPRENLILDFFIPSVSMAVECQGEQHFRQIKHFHGTKKIFHEQQQRDERKRQWCELNGIKLIEIHYGNI